MVDQINGMREDVEQTFRMLLGENVSENAIEEAVEDIIETSSYKEDGVYSSGDVSIAVKRIIIKAIQNSYQ